MATDLSENPKSAAKLVEIETLLLLQMKEHKDAYKLSNQK